MPALVHRSLALASIAALAIQAWIGPTGGPMADVAVASAVALAVIAVLAGDATSRPITALVALVALAVRTGVLWQAALAVALAVFLGLARLLPRIAPGAGWRRRGRVPVLATAIVGGMTPFGLVGWFVLMRPDLDDLVAAYLPEAPLAVLVLGAVAFAVINAVLEELVWRGVMTDALERGFGPWPAIAIQAASFGLAHAHGFPRGALGIVLAGGWAVALGMLRRHAGGLAAPIVAHVVADASIATIVLVALR